MATFSQVVEAASGLLRLSPTPLTSTTKCEENVGSIRTVPVPPLEDDKFLVSSNGMRRTLGAVDYFSNIPVPTLFTNPGDVGGSSVTVRWTNSVAGTTTRIRYKMANLSTWSAEITVAAGLSAYTITSLFPDTAYHIQARQYLNGILSGYSVILPVTTTIPYTPFQLIVVDGTNPFSQVSFYWNSAAGPISAWQIQRASNSSFSVGLVSYTGDVAWAQPYTVGGLTVATPYWYRAQLIGSGLGYEATVEHCTSPLAPANCVQLYGTVNSVAIGWQNTTANVYTATDVDRAPLPSGPWVTVKQSPRGTSATSLVDDDPTLTPGTRYYYRAVHNAGASAASYRRGQPSNVVLGKTAPIAPVLNAVTSMDEGISVSYEVRSNCPLILHYSTDPTFSSPYTEIRLPEQRLGQHHYPIYGIVSGTTYYVRMQHVQYTTTSAFTITLGAVAGANLTVKIHQVLPIDSTSFQVTYTPGRPSNMLFEVYDTETNQMVTNRIWPYIGLFQQTMIFNGLTAARNYAVRASHLSPFASPWSPLASCSLFDVGATPQLLDPIQIRGLSGWCNTLADHEGIRYSAYYTALNCTYVTHFVAITRRLSGNPTLVATNLDPRDWSFEDNMTPLYEDLVNGVPRTLEYDFSLYNRNTGLVTTITSVPETIFVTTCVSPP